MTDHRSWWKRLTKTLNWSNAVYSVSRDRCRRPFGPISNKTLTARYWASIKSETNPEAFQRWEEKLTFIKLTWSIIWDGLTRTEESVALCCDIIGSRWHLEADSQIYCQSVFFIIVDVVRPSLSLSAEQGADLTLLFNTWTHLQGRWHHKQLRANSGPVWRGNLKPAGDKHFYDD